MNTYDIEKLPKWARDEITTLRRNNEQLEATIAKLSNTEDAVVRGLYFAVEDSNPPTSSRSN